MKFHPIASAPLPKSPALGPNAIASAASTPAARSLRVQISDGGMPSNLLPKDQDYFTRARQPSISIPNTAAPDDFSGWAGPGGQAKPEHGPSTPNTPGGLIGRLKHFGKTKKAGGDPSPNSPVPTVVPETPMVVEVSGVSFFFFVSGVLIFVGPFFALFDRSLPVREIRSRRLCRCC
jgi:WD repeat-containing protein 48